MKMLITCLLSILLLPSHAQNIGIGITNPVRSKLEVIGVSGAQGSTSALFGSDGRGISFQRNWPSIGFNQFRDYPTGNGTYIGSGYAAIQYLDPGSGVMAIDMLGTGTGNTGTANPTRAITFLNNGNVGIRVGNPQASLHVARGTGVNGTAVFAGKQHWSHFSYSSAEDTYIRAGTDNGNLYLNYNVNSNVLIGGGNTRIGMNRPGIYPTSTIEQKYYFNGQFTLSNSYNQPWTQYLDFAPSGVSNLDLILRYFSQKRGVFAYDYGGYYNSSDRRLKTNIEPLPPVLKEVNELNPVSYTMIHHNPLRKRSIGFIAQEVKPLFPSFVRIVDDHARKGIYHKDLHSLYYRGFFVIAIKALQEQYQQIKDLQKEQDELLQKLIMIQNKLDTKDD